MKLLSNFPGHKADYDFDFTGCKTYLDPFVGNGAGLGHAIAQGIKTAWIAEKEPALRHLWRCLIDDTLTDLIGEISGSIDSLPLESNRACLDGITKLWDGTLSQRLAARLFLSIVGFNGLSRTRRDDPDALWVCVYPWPTEGALAKNPNSKGRLSGNTAEEKRANLRDRCYRDFNNWCELTKLLKPIKVRLFDDCYALADALPELPRGRVGVLIDPPYYLNPLDGHKSITASYPGHLPHDYATWNLCANMVDSIFHYAHRAYVTNYASSQLTMLMAGWGCNLTGGKRLKQCGHHAKNNLVSASGQRHRAKIPPFEQTYHYQRGKNRVPFGQLSIG